MRIEGFATFGFPRPTLKPCVPIFQQSAIERSKMNHRPWTTEIERSSLFALCRRAGVLSAIGFALMVAVASVDASDTYEEEPISYSSPEVNDPVARLQERLNFGEAKLEFDKETG